MGTLKDEALTDNSEDVQQHKLTDPEVNYLRLLNIALQFHTMGQQIMTGFLYYVSISRLGYTDGVNLQFEFNLDAQDNMLTVKLLPTPPTPPAPPMPRAPKADAPKK